jgi:hypothetical protein
MYEGNQTSPAGPPASTTADSRAHRAEEKNVTARSVSDQDCPTEGDPKSALIASAGDGNGSRGITVE